MATKKTTSQKGVTKKIVAKKAATKKVALSKAPKKQGSKPTPQKLVKKTVVKVAPKPKKAAKAQPAAVKKAKTASSIKKAVSAKVKLAKKLVKKEVKKVVAQPKPSSKPIHKKIVESSAVKHKTAVATPAKPVKVPKINARTSVPYKPGYTPLEKRIEPIMSNEPIVRYNDTDLGEFRDLISKKLDSAKKELAYLQGLITRKDEMGGDEAENRYMTMEDGGMSMEREQLSQMAGRQITYIGHLEKALIRIENKTYGICRVTGKLIDKARLRAVPHATLSLEAKLGLVKPNGE